MQCKFCGREGLSLNSNIQHELRCKKNPDKIKVIPSYGMLGKTGSNQYIKAEQLGLPKPVLSDETREKFRISSASQTWTEERRINHRQAMRRAVEHNPESYTSSNRGRTKQIEYDGIKFQGKWELEFYCWAKDNEFNLIRPTVGFKYTWNGDRTYFPDFYIESLDSYVEVKGYETERDRAKWNQFTKKLCVIKKKEIKEIQDDKFTVDSLIKLIYNSHNGPLA